MIRNKRSKFPLNNFQREKIFLAEVKKLLTESGKRGRKTNVLRHNRFEPAEKKFFDEEKKCLTGAGEKRIKRIRREAAGSLKSEERVGNRALSSIGRETFRVNTFQLESLILAQIERWRRA